MGAVPNKKLTRARQGRRFTAYRLRRVYPSLCPQCRHARASHTACPSCGFYRGRQVVGASQ